MLKNKIVQASIFSVGIILVIYLLGAAISLTGQRPINKPTEMVGVPGIQVTVVNKAVPNAKPVSVMTDAGGKFDLGILPAGTYALSIQMTDSARKIGNMTGTEKQNANASSAALSTVKVTVEGTTDGAISKGWELREQKSFDLPDTQMKMNQDMRKDQTKRIELKPDITFTTDGKQKVKGAVHDMSMTPIRNLRG